MAPTSSGKSWHSLSEYEAFRALIHSGTTTAAGAQLGLSQSAISRAISSLEARMGCTFFEREAGRLRPTQEALVLNRRLDALFDSLDLIDGSSEPVQETLRLIAPPSYGHRYLVEQINSFLQMNPHFYISFEVNTSEEVTRGIQEDRYDLGIAGVEYSRAGVKQIPFRTAEAVCAMTQTHHLAKQDQIHPKDLHAQDMITLISRHARRGQLDRILNQVSARPNFRAEVSTSFAAVDLVKEGLGIAVINPFPLYHYRSDDLAFIRFVSAISYKIYFVVSDTKPVPRIARAFMRHLRLNTQPDPFSKKV